MAFLFMIQLEVPYISFTSRMDLVRNAPRNRLDEYIYTGMDLLTAQTESQNVPILARITSGMDIFYSSSVWFHITRFLDLPMLVSIIIAY